MQSNTTASDVNGYGAIYSHGSHGSLTITNSLLRGNSAGRYGGAISASGKVLIQNTTFTGNTALLGSAIHYHGAAGLLLSYSSVSNNANAAIFNETQMTILESTLSNNGEGLYTYPFNPDPLSPYAATTVINTTFSNNTVGVDVGHYGSASLQHVTIFGSTLWGVHAIGDITSALRVIDVVIQKSTNASINSKNCDLPFPAMIVSHGFNISSDYSCLDYFTKTGDKNNVDSGLGALANNGGPTLTHLPQAGSPLIDGGVCTNGIITDQRGFTRPSGAACDIGAVEMQPPDFILPRAHIPIVVK